MMTREEQAELRRILPGDFRKQVGALLGPGVDADYVVGTVLRLVEENADRIAAAADAWPDTRNTSSISSLLT